MSGHSKWSKVKHQKETTDAVKGKIFTKMSSAIMIAVKEGGGGDPNSNFRLRLAIEKAKSHNMPKENIERAIEKAVKAGSEGGMEQHVYEAFAPGGVGIIIEATTDNKQRTVSEIKNTLERHGGVLASSGSVSHLFDYVGFIEVTKTGKTFDQIMEIALDAGAIDLSDQEKAVDIYTSHDHLHKIKEELVKKGLTVTESELIYKAVSIVSIENPNQMKKTEELLQILEERDDVAAVFANL
ncbi:hypothetical protein A3D77_02655 [Candidatus Gottesmanbacteria bacterium RIFCSPHIGHO2_02_FULL_39_11]|uniref:Probable transcriptional regulatory protein A3D77_02655 n=1 Tax=Candidatus Gottesmanbacteria bacterium RIFCSPHIGHO2_02_FULL_39_11 TaxID=1798382 RepID=A0A1F5ZT83_9BACT|nr:MAG: hypothetical protein A3D77_02655 [Candidatus Gottesmanbacteria bacterium RIFCSPHIGHO2_02_FULL_39_11]